MNYRAIGHNSSWKSIFILHNIDNPQTAEEIRLFAELSFSARSSERFNSITQGFIRELYIS